MAAEPFIKHHLGGEEGFVFPTAGGPVELKVTDDALTPYGGLVPWAAFARKCGIIEQLARTCPHQRRSPNAAKVYDVLQSFILTALVDGRRFSHVGRLREDPTICELFGMDKVVSDDTIRRFLGSLDEAAASAWVAQAAQPLWAALPERLILDWDSTVQTKYGHQQGAEVGYNPTKRGRKSFHPLLAVAAGTRLCPAYRFRSGNSVSASQWQEACMEAQQNLGERRVWLNRGDIGFGQEKIMAWHENAPGAEARPHYLFKLKVTTNLKRALAKIPAHHWQGEESLGLWQVAEAQVQLPSWSARRRIVFARKLQGVVSAQEGGTFWKEHKHEIAIYVTNLPVEQANAWQIMALYRERADAENVFDEIKNQWGFNGFCAQNQRVSALAAQLLLLAYNLWNLFLRLLEPKRHVEAAGGRRWFLLIAARLVRSGRSKGLQVCVQGAWWQQLKEGYERLGRWLALTAPQLAGPTSWELEDAIANRTNSNPKQAKPRSNCGI